MTGGTTITGSSVFESAERQREWNSVYNTDTITLLRKNTFRASLVREADRAYGISVNDIQAEIFGNVLGSKLQGVSVYFEETGPVVVEGLGRFYLNSVISFDEYESAYNNALAGNYGKAAGFAALGIVLEVPGKVIKPFKYAGKAVKALFKGSKVVGEVAETAGTVNTGVKLVHGSEKALTTIGDSGKIITFESKTTQLALYNPITSVVNSEGKVLVYFKNTGEIIPSYDSLIGIARTGNFNTPYGKGLVYSNEPYGKVLAYADKNNLIPIDYTKTGSYLNSLGLYPTPNNPSPFTVVQADSIMGEASVNYVSNLKGNVTALVDNALDHRAYKINEEKLLKVKEQVKEIEMIFEKLEK